MTIVVSEQCTNLAFYGIEPRPDAIERLYRQIVAWFESHGVTPDRAAIEGTGFSGKFATFKGMSTRLRRAGFSTVTDFTLISSLPDAHISLSQYFMAADLQSKSRLFVISMRHSLVPLSRETLLPFTRDLAQDLNARYGIGYSRSAELGPIFYAIGLVMGLGETGLEDVEGDHIGFWADAKRIGVWEQGLLRDVYPWNFLNEAQLSRPVGGVPFADWIRAAPGRGTLEAFGEMNFWEVPEEDIRALRRTLWLEGNIFHWPRDLERMATNPGAILAHTFWE